MVLKWFLSISINYCVDLTENVYQDNFAGMWSGNFSKKKPGYLPGFLILWWALRDSNPEPRDYESPALTVAPRALVCDKHDWSAVVRFQLFRFTSLNSTMHGKYVQCTI